MSPARRRVCIEHVRRQFAVSERGVCAALGQHGSTQRKTPRGRDDEARLTADIVELARRYGRYGYRRVTALLRAAGWLVNPKRVERIWRSEGLKVPARQPKKGRLWLNEGSCIRLRPEHRDHVWAYDFVEDRTHDGRKLRMLSDKRPAFALTSWTRSRECLAIRVARKLKVIDVIDVLSDLFMPHAACRVTSAPTTGPSSSPGPCRTGSVLSAREPRPSPPAVRGRTAMLNPSTPGSGMNCWTETSFTLFVKHR